MKFFAGTRFAGDQHSGVGGRDAFEPVDHGLHQVAGIDDAFEAEPFVEPTTELDVFPPQLLRLNRLVGGRSQSVGSNWLFR